MSFMYLVRTSCTKSLAKASTLISSSHSILRSGFIGRSSFGEQRPLSCTPAIFSGTRAPPGQSVSPLAPIGINAALQAATDPSITPKPQIFDEFALNDRVGIVSGGNRGLGLEMALALCEAGARAIYCFDLPTKPSDEWTKTEEYVKRMENGSRLEYVSVDVRDQQVVWRKAQEIGDREKRMDVCVAAAGILKSHTDCLTYPAEQFKEVG
jgi:short chain dehydrogenase